jgi:hypothetical protein
MSDVDTLEGKFYLPHCFIFTTAPIRMIIIDANHKNPFHCVGRKELYK